jgi:GT2 family glycosyltransferase
VIPTWNARELLALVLPTLAAQRFTDFASLVVDNGSTDGTVAYLEREWPTVAVLALPVNIGFAPAVNRGIEATRSEYVALLNNDIELDPDWLGELAAALDAHPEAASATPKLINYHDRSMLDGAGDELSWSGVCTRRGYRRPDAGQYDIPEAVFSACGGAALYRRASLDRIGLFDEDFFAYLEDADWGFRAQLAGYSCRYVPSSRAYHIAGATTDRVSDLGAYLRRRNMIAVVLKNYPARSLLRHLPELLLEQVLGIALSITQRTLTAQIRAWRDATRQLPATLRKRRAVQRVRTIGDAQLEAIVTGDVAGVRRVVRELRARPSLVLRGRSGDAH